jgi:broad specificity phosphatase PhoE
MRHTRFLERRGIVRIYSSGAVRSLQSVQHVSVTLGLRPIVDDRIGEWSYGSGDPGAYRQTLEHCFRNHDRSPVGGMSIASVESRLSSLLTDLEVLGAPVLIATHGVCVSLLLSGCRPLVALELWREMPHAALYLLDWSESITQYSRLP